MALKATIYKAQLQIADLDRHYYGTHSLTLACHPSETEERLMVRLLTFALFASDTLTFTRGLSSENEPDLWDIDLTGRVTHWIELGTPDEARIRKGCSRAERMSILSYGARTAPVWWEKTRDKLTRFDKLSVFYLPKETTEALGSMVSRNMDLQATIQDGQLWFSDAKNTVAVTPQQWL